MTLHWRWLKLGKQLLHLCSAPGLTLCILSGFSINKTLSPKTLSSKRSVGFTPLTHHYQDCLVRQSRGRELPVFLTGVPWGKELLCVTGVVALCLARSWQVVTGDADSSRNSPDSPTQTPLPSFHPLFLQPWWCCAMQPVAILGGMEH